MHTFAFVPYWDSLFQYRKGECARYPCRQSTRLRYRVLLRSTIHDSFQTTKRKFHFGPPRTQSQTAPESSLLSGVWIHLCATREYRKRSLLPASNSEVETTHPSCRAWPSSGSTSRHSTSSRCHRRPRNPNSQS